MIDINELRQSAQAATPGPWYIGSGTYEGRNIYSAEAVTDDEGFTYNPVVATAEDDDVVCWETNARLIAAANPAVISELLDRLEAAEKERDVLRNEIAYVKEVEFPRKSQAVADGWKGKCKRLEVERDALRAKLEAAESDAAHQKALTDSALRVAEGWEKKCNSLRAALRHEADCVEAAKAEIEAMRAKIERMEQQEPVAKVRVHRTGGNAGLAWSVAPLNDFDSLPLMRDGDRLYALPGAKGERND